MIDQKLRREMERYKAAKDWSEALALPALIFVGVLGVLFVH